MSARPARDTYRHGNLREAALAAARAMVETGGHEALSLRRVAQAAGVAHRSLYGHFSDREALLDAVAQTGFEDLAVPLAKAASRADFVAAYAGFALANPRLYDLMRSRPHATMKFRPPLQKAVHLGITQAMRLFADPAASKEANRRAVMRVLILLHGGIAMHRSGILDVPGDEGLIAELQAMMG